MQRDAMSASSPNETADPTRRRRVRPFPYAELDRYGRAQVAAARTLLAHLPETAGVDWPLCQQALGGEVRFRIVECYASPVRQLEAEIGGVVVGVIGPGGRRALVALDGRLAPRVARAALGLPLGDELLAPRALTLAEEGGLLFIVGALFSGMPLRPTALLSIEAAQKLLRATSDDGWLLVLDAQVSTPVGHGWVKIVATDALRLSLPWPRRVTRDISRLAAVVGEARVELARMTLTHGAVRTLQRGDVVVFDGRSAVEGGRSVARLTVGRGGFAARIEGNALWIESAYETQGGAPMVREPREPEAAAPPPASTESQEALLRDLPVELTAEVGRLRMTAKELVELSPGAVLPLGRPLAGPVELVVGGKIVAVGELVDIEGELGVRLVELRG